jgi:hypothetical protein
MSILNKLLGLLREWVTRKGRD